MAEQGPSNPETVSAAPQELAAVARSPLRRLIVHFVHFLTGNALTMLLGLITFPILTRLLPRDEYGVLGLVTTTISIAVALAKGGLSDGIIRFYRDFAGSPERLQVFTSTVIVRGVLLSALVCALYGLAIPLIAQQLGIDRRFLICFYVMLPYLFVRPLNIIVLNYYRALGLTVRYNVNNVATRALGIAASLILLVYVVKSLYGYFVGIALAEVVAGVVLLTWLLRRYTVRPSSASGPLSLDLLRFGVPLLLTELSYLLFSYVDRYMIVAIHGEDMLGLYSVGYNLPSYINELVMFSLSYAVVPIYTELHASKGKAATEAFLSKAFRYYIVVMLPLCAIYAAVSRDLLIFLASKKYADAATFSPIILVALALLGMNAILAAGLYLHKRTKVMLGIMLTALAVNVALNLAFLPHFGTIGAALSTLAATMVSVFLTWQFGRAHLRVTLHLPTLVFYAAVAIPLVPLARTISTGQVFLDLVFKSVACGAFVVAAILVREPEVRSMALRVIARLRPHPSS